MVVFGHLCKKERKEEKLNFTLFFVVQTIKASHALSIGLIEFGTSLLGEKSLLVEFVARIPDGVNQVALVFELVTLCAHVERVVSVVVNTVGVTELAQDTTKDSLTNHPHSLHVVARVERTLAFTDATMTTVKLALLILGHTKSRLALYAFLYN